MINKEIQEELDNYHPAKLTSPETVEMVIQYIKEGFNITEAKIKAAKMRNKLKYAIADTTEDDKYMKDHFDSLEEKECECLLKHGETAEKGKELCEVCQLAHDERSVGANDGQSTREIIQEN